MNSSHILTYILFLLSENINDYVNNLNINTDVDYDETCNMIILFVVQFLSSFKDKGKWMQDQLWFCSHLMSWFGILDELYLVLF